MAYTTAAIVKQLIVGSYDSTTDLTDAQIAVHIANADGFINSRLSKLWGLFNATGDTPATPGVVARASALLSAVYSLQQLNIRGALSDRISEYRDEAYAIVSGLEDPNGQMNPETVTSETLTFGDGDPAFELQQYYAFVGNGANNPRKATNGGPPNIAAESVQIATCTGVTNPTQLRNGIDFRVWWEPQWKQWILEALASEIQSAADSGTVAVSYRWDYRRMDGYSRPMGYRLVIG